jgi:hypothetical protein
MAEPRQADYDNLSSALSELVGFDLVVLPGARLEEVRSVLGTFAAFAPQPGSGPPDDFVITQGSRLAKRQLTMGDCRAAQALLGLLGGAHG